MMPSPIPPKVKSLFITQSPDTAYLNNIDFGMGKIPAIVSLLRIKHTYQMFGIMFVLSKSQETGQDL